MLSRLGRHVNPASLLALVALFVALGGTGYAAVKLNGKNIQNNSIPGWKVKTNTLHGKKLKNGKVHGKKIKNGTVTGAKVREASLGTVPDAARLGGEPADGYQPESGLRFATIAPANAGAAVVRGRGATDVDRVGNGYYAVTFDREVDDCTWIATYGRPDNGGVGDVWATVRGGPSPDEVRVVLRDDAGNQADGAGFHVAALCP